MCGVWRHEPHRPGAVGQKKGDESAKPTEYFSWAKPGHSKSEYRHFSTEREKRLVQQDRAHRHTAEDPDMGKAERDVCLFHEDDNDQSAYPCPSPLIDRDGDDLEDLMVVLPCQVWFDTEAPEAFERNNLDTIATTVQHLRTLARSEVRIESPREISVSSVVFGASVGTQKVGGVRREQRDETNRCCWTADRRRSGNTTERS